MWSVAFSPGGRTLATASEDQTVRSWNVSGGQPFKPVLEGHTGSVVSFAFSADGKTLASGSVNARVRLWDVSGRAVGKICLYDLARETLTRSTFEGPNNVTRPMAGA